MRHKTRYASIFNDRTMQFPFMLMYLFALLSTVHTQSTASINTTPSSTSILSTQMCRPTINIRVSSHSPSSTMSPPLSRSIDQTQRDPALAARQSDDHQLHTRESVFNYYFLFFALFVVIIAGALWWVHRRRKIQKEQMRISGQNALAQDLEGWYSTSHFIHGGYTRRQIAPFVRREEGLDEHGEAPPPYLSKSEIAVVARGPEQPNSNVTIPLRTLPRDEIERVRPPVYDETVPTSYVSTARPSCP